jgi:hypothetical protein
VGCANDKLLYKGSTPEWKLLVGTSVYFLLWSHADYDLLQFQRAHCPKRMIDPRGTLPGQLSMKRNNKTPSMCPPMLTLDFL